MRGICVILVLVMAVGVAVKAEYRRSIPEPFPPLLPPVMNVTTCAATSCIRGQLCRIVLKTDGSIGPLCLDPSDVPRRGSTRVCGSSGHPLLVERTSRRRRVRYTQFRVQRGQQCPEDLVRRFSACCAETEKVGACPAADTVRCRRSSCRGDNQCRGDEKCCENSCGKSACADPITSKTVCSTANCIPGIPCAILDCAPGFFCVETPDGPKCDRDTPVTCALIDCFPDFTCIDFPNGSRCVPLNSTCAVVFCPVGLNCVETPNGATCEPATQKPGFCPLGPVVGFCDPRTPTCQTDADCADDKICCELNCKRGTCETPVSDSACASVTCEDGDVCVDTRRGPECRPANKPGACPPLLVTREEVGVCAETCQNDSSCVDEQKCCPTVCGGLTCADPVPPTTCAVILCLVGTICVETPNGAECRPVEKPGQCPPPLPTGEGEGECTRTCQNDSSCEDTQKCCPTLCGGLACNEAIPPATCAATLCLVGTICVETPNGAECRPVEKSGQCPPPLPGEGVDECARTCKNDSSCDGTQKCCATLCGGFTCKEAVPLPSCATILCLVGSVCECQLEADKPGVCPPPFSLRQETGVCAQTCQNDSSCDEDQKCCRAACGGLTCADPIPPPTCASVPCIPGTVCVETPSGIECRDVDKPGVCPVPPPDTPGICATTCDNDLNCTGVDKCCRTACGGRTCIQVLTCATVECREGNVCIDMPNGPECRLVNKPGNCPVPGPGEVGICAFTCDNDASCEGTDKCCRTACGGRTCTPVITCANVLCARDRPVCVETDDGPRCIVQKPGICPIFPCPPPPVDLIPSPSVCVDQCQEDNDCEGARKCCNGCSPCRSCFDPFDLPPLCDSVECGLGEVCRLEQVACVAESCSPVPTCVPIGSTVGQCPAVARDTAGTCSYECETDANCGPGGKCCLTACGGTACTAAVPVNTCATVRCGSGKICREIYDPDSLQVYPQCVDEPTEPPFDVCEIGLPLLLAPVENNTGVFCGRGFDSRRCPDGYTCNTSPIDLYAVCCRTTSPIPKPGECPPPVGFGICAFTCKDDNSCQGAQKCCRTACSGSQCMNPVTNVTKDGVCPPVLCAENPPICIVNQCERDSDCTGDQKCCDGCGCRRCFTPILISTGCDRVLCPKGQRCVENDEGTECVPIEKPGICPQLRCADRVCEGRNACREDGDCGGKLKCCKGCSGCMECLAPSLLPTPPPPSCLTVRCSADTECVETAEGPKCLPRKSGTCPRLNCTGSVPQPCVSFCEADSDCKGELKCCEGCSGCSKCVAPLPLDPLQCGSQTCQPGEECREQTIFCIRAPCPGPFFTCVSTAISEGQCPTARPPLNSTCENQCSFDQECARGEKCCSTLCGAAACTETVRPATCDTARCPFRSQTCREVYDMDTVTPNCFENPLETLQDDQCRVGLPLLLRNFPGGEITQANCGQERDAITCPNGYICQVGPGGAFSVCCRDEEQPCNPPCGPGTTCVTTPINCLVPPCPPTPRCEATDTTDICQLPKDVGPCRAAVPSFFFNPASQQCEAFIYGGCDGNDNRFPTLAACIATCANDTCSLPKVVGPCEALFPSYFYNSDSGQCEFFNYGGCQGNSNRFSSRADCLAVCSAIQDKCLLPPEKGPCRAAFTNYFYNPETNDCEEFTYGGCGGNDNRFSSREACIQECAPDICTLPADAGPCLALFPSYYYDTQSNSCKAFNYGGCKGNANRFPSFRSCEQACRTRRSRYLG